MAQGLRVDRWLWSVRLFKTRTAATKACDAGAVTINGDSVKPARRVRVDDTVQIKRKVGYTEVVVVELLEKRVSAALAANAYVDQSPEPDPDEVAMLRAIGMREPTRERGEGRPTKRDRRRLDEFRGRYR